jgi:deazaflavin-dependent oxidoreductase (nitroreductase family)
MVRRHRCHVGRLSLERNGTMTTTDRGETPTRDRSPATSGPGLAPPLLYRLIRATSPLFRPLAGRRFFPLWAVLRHRGRRSGREYEVPVGLRAAPDAYYVALVFGDRTQWVRNVMAAGGCSVRWRGRDIALTDPTIVRADEAAFAFPAVLRWMMRAVGADQLIRFRPMASA